MGGGGGRAPPVSRGGRGYVSLFVTGRWVQSRRLAYAVEEAYRGLLMVGRYPIAALNLRLPLEEVDVNVHPTKAEGRFRDGAAAVGAVERAPRGPGAAPAARRGAQQAVPLQVQPWTSPLWEHARSLERREAGVAAEETPTRAGATPAVALPALRGVG